MNSTFYEFIIMMSPLFQAFHFPKIIGVIPLLLQNSALTSGGLGRSEGFSMGGGGFFASLHGLSSSSIACEKSFSVKPLSNIQSYSYSIVLEFVLKSITSQIFLP